MNSKGELDLEALPLGLRMSVQRQIESGDYQKQGCIQALEVQVEWPPDLKAVVSFEAGGYRFCKKDSRWPEPPEIGDQVMLFPYMPPGDEAGQVIAPFPDGFEVIFERKKDGGLSFPKALRDAPDLIGVRRLEIVRERVAEHLKTSTGL